MGCFASKPAEPLAEDKGYGKAISASVTSSAGQPTAEKQHAPAVCNGEGIKKVRHALLWLTCPYCREHEGLLMCCCCSLQVEEDHAEPAAAPAADEAQHQASDAASSSPLMVLYKDVPAEAPDPADEQQRFNQLCSYNILDTVSTTACAKAAVSFRTF
jgi:hypothetical protein